MINKQGSRIVRRPVSSAVHIWTVVSLVGDRISCSTHSSEYHAYREAVSRFEAAELDTNSEDRELRILLEAANTCGDYQGVRKYIEDNACQLRLLQLAEHNVNDIPGYPVSAPQLTQNANLYGRPQDVLTSL
jgi:hypothetical protein